MKKNFRFSRLTAIFILVLLAFSAMPLALIGCSSPETPLGDDNTSAIVTDIDHSKLSVPMTIDVINQFSPTRNIGKTVKLRADFGGVYDFTNNTYVNVIEQYDKTACCAAYYKVKLAEGVQRPAIGSRVEIVGVFENDYINVTAITLYKGEWDTTSYEIDAANMTREELGDFLMEIDRISSAHTGKTVRICGHLGSSAEGYYFVVGFDKGSTPNSVKAAWDFEIHSNTVQLPKFNDNAIRTYEMIGTVSYYTTEGGAPFPCIEITTIRPITTYTF